MSLEAVVLEHSYDLKEEGTRGSRGFVGVRSRKEIGHHTVMDHKAILGFI